MPLITDTEARQATPLAIQNVPVPEAEPEPRNLLESAGRIQNTMLSAGHALGDVLERRQIRTRRAAKASMKALTVLPLPTPRVMPSGTCSAAA